MFHRHKWEVTEKDEQMAPIEVMRKAGLTKLGNAFLENGLTTRPIIVHYRCKCGAEQVVRV